MKNWMILPSALFFLILGSSDEAIGQSKFHFFIGPGAAYYQGDVSESGLPDPRMIRFNLKEIFA